MAADQQESMLLKQEDAIKQAKIELYAQQDMVRAVLESKDREIEEL